MHPHELQRQTRYFDWISFFLIIILSVVGLLLVYSATYSEHIPYSLFFKKQVCGVISGIVLYIIFSYTDHRSMTQLGYVLYFCIMGLLLFTLVKGSIGMGAQRWINLGFIKFQPSEITKLFLPAFVVNVLYAHADHVHAPHLQKQLLLLLGCIIISALLILKQPDLGTSILIGCSGLFLLWAAGLKKIYVIGLGCLFLLCAPLGWKMLKPYQQQRIAVFLGEGQSHKERYQLEQGIIAIGSGGLHGKGFLKGTQNRLMFLPEGRTDFIFAVLSEEWGFLGACFVLFLYICLFARLLFITWSITNPHLQVMIFGLWIHIFLSCIVNVCMVLGLLPIVGIPLPLLSYGISNLWTVFASLGWINSIWIRKQLP